MVDSTTIILTLFLTIYHLENVKSPMSHKGKYYIH